MQIAIFNIDVEIKMEEILKIEFGEWEMTKNGYHSKKLQIAEIVALIRPNQAFSSRKYVIILPKWKISINKTWYWCQSIIETSEIMIEEIRESVEEYSMIASEINWKVIDFIKHPF